ncbi:hypothetical protein [Arsukibacterium ikkense]|nr:hypothetical protein [Arsukibacterium ikkense]
MTQLLDWLTHYSPLVVLLLAVAAALLFLIKLIVEKSIAAEFEHKAKVFELLLTRRSAFEEKVLLDRFALVTGFSSQLELVMTQLNRIRSGQPVPDGFMTQQEIVPLTQVFIDLEVQRLLLGEDFHRVFTQQALLALSSANIAKANKEAWCQAGEQWGLLRQELRQTLEAAFSVSNIRW